MANFTCLAAARHEVLRRAGWNVETHGLQKAPRVRVIAGGEVHISAVGALRYLGFGTRRDRADSGRRSGPHARGCARRCAREERCASTRSGPDHRVRAGRQRQHRRVRSARGDRAKRACAWRLGARRRRVRPLGGGGSGIAIAGRKASSRRFVGDRRAQVAQRPVRLRPRDRRRCGAASRRDEHEGVVSRSAATTKSASAWTGCRNRHADRACCRSMRCSDRSGATASRTSSAATARWRGAWPIAVEGARHHDPERRRAEPGARAVHGRRDDAAGDRGGAGGRHVLGGRRVLAEQAGDAGVGVELVDD